MPKPTPFLWFADQAEEAANFYVSIFPNSRIVTTTRYPENSPGPAGQVMTLAFELDGQPFTALNGGHSFTFNEAVSFVVGCADQAELDHYWDRLLDGGMASQCGWLKDRYGLSWQIVPENMAELVGGPDRAKASAATQAMLRMVKLDVAALQAARDAA